MAAQFTQTTTNRRFTTSEARQLSRAEVSQVHKENIRQRLEHRLRIAREQGNQDLIRLLEAEQRQAV